MDAKAFLVSILIVGATFAETGKAPVGAPSAPKVLYVDSEKGDDAGGDGGQPGADVGDD